MTPAEYRAALSTLGLSVYASAPALCISLRTAQRYASGEADIPPDTAKLLRALVALERVTVWQPMNTAPRDGGYIVVRWAHSAGSSPIVVHWADGMWRLEDSSVTHLTYRDKSFCGWSPVPFTAATGPA